MLWLLFVLGGWADAVTVTEQTSASFEVLSGKVNEGLTKMGRLKKDATTRSLMQSALKSFSKVGAQITPADAQALQAMRALLFDIQELVEFEVATRNDYLDTQVQNMSNCDEQNYTEINITVTNLDVLQEAHTTCRLAHAAAYYDKSHTHHNLHTWQGSNQLVTDDTGSQFHLSQVCALPDHTEAAIVGGEWMAFIDRTALWFETNWPLFSEKANAYIDAYAEESGNNTLCDAAQQTYETEVCAAKVLWETVCVERAACWAAINTTTTSGVVDTWREDNEMHPVLIQTSYYVDCLIGEMLKNTTEAMIGAGDTCQQWLDEPITFNSTNFSAFFVNTTLLEPDSPVLQPNPANCSYYQELDMNLFIPFSADTTTNAPSTSYWRHIVDGNANWLWNTSGIGFHSNFMETFFTNEVVPGPQCSTT